MRTCIPILIFLLISLSAPFSAAARESVVLVIDASGSMWGRIGDKPKIDIAREVIRSILRDWDPQNPVGLMAYGHRRKGDCQDIELLVPPGRLEHEAFLRRLQEVTPKGKTPLSAAVQQAASALKFEEDPATVILVSDGRETCTEDPCQMAEQLKKLGVSFTIHTIGFDLQDEAGVAQLKCMAEKTGGRYLAAADASALKLALQKAVQEIEQKPRPDPNAKGQLTLKTVLTPGGRPVGGGWFYVFREEPDEFGKPKRIKVASWGYGEQASFQLPPGQYIARVEVGSVAAEAPVEIRPATHSDKELVLNAGYAHLYTVLKSGGKKIGGAWFDVFREEMDEFGKPKRIRVASSGYSAEKTFLIPAGNYIARAKLGSASAEAPIRVEPGGRLSQELDLNAGKLRLIARLVPGGKPAGGSWFDVYRESTDEFGKPRRIKVTGHGYSDRAEFIVPAGRYIVTASLGKAQTEAEVTVEAGRGIEQDLVLNAGRLELSSAPGSWFYVYREERDATGNIRRVRVASTGYGASASFVLPEGEYIAQAELNNKKAEARVKVLAGQFTQKSLPYP